MRRIFLSALVLLSSVASAQQTAPKASFKIDYEKFTLANGLQVIFHIDRSDPVVAVSLTAHVGSAREKPGRTGFAHLFEHLLFLESENLGKGGLDKMTARIGGSGANGSTNTDRTNYLQTVPNDALEKMIWAEADKLGWFINTVTDPVLAKEKQVVKNEKRQSYDNNPYGHTYYVINKQLYPANHPYNWQVIGSLEDLQNATLADVKEFFNRWYVPNNVTLVLAGDFDKVQARKWVEKYFNEIKPGEALPELPKQRAIVKQTIKVYHEDNFAKLPELTMVWPTVEEYHPDSYALQVLAQYLSEGKKAPLYNVLVEDKKLTSNVSMFNITAELAGQMHLSVRAFAGKDLDLAAAAVGEAFAKFEKEGISEKDLSRIKAGLETGFYSSLSSVLGKGSQLAQYNIFAGDPGFTEKDINSTLAVTTADVKRVYEKYIKNKNYVATSFVPKGEIALALEGSTKADVVEEAIVQGAEESIDASANATYTRTPSSFDRSKEPAYGKTPEIKTPTIWTDQLNNGLKLYGIENNEVPLVQFELVMDGGMLLEDINKIGVANLMAKMMTQGTKNKTPEQLEDAIEQLGASINFSSSAEDIRVRVTTLARNYTATLALLQEILLEPRWDVKEFDLLKQNVISQIRQQEANPGAIAQNTYNQLLYGKDNIRSKNTLGTLESVNKITLDDLKAYYSKNLSPSIARMHVVGSLNKTTITNSLASLANLWKNKTVAPPTLVKPIAPTKSQIYFYDVPDAKQSVIRFGYPALAATDKDYYPVTVMNYILGGGGFASQLTQQLREGKGYTYGINSGFSGTNNVGPFTIASNVRTNVTLESAQAVKEILENYGKNYSDKDLATTKGFLIKSNARAFETAGSKLNMLENISKYGWKADYVKEREEIVKNMSIAEIQALAKKYLDANKMIWLFVGDAKTQLPRLSALGFGEPILIK
ncbi:M16 family metallopeptidase [Pedobacter namyangjuensis]|uniref:M16 family metallopeptidase n=1 Tax=Pedobacter namyangjuensis TaxID=600626 RepID=UPI000DE517BD|nr:pitrilysin family protein [Pedobacter namyangjuensis]